MLVGRLAPAPAEHATGPVAGVLAERIDQLPIVARQLLDVLAVARRPCPPQVVAQLLPGGPDIRTVMRLAAQLSRDHLVHIDTVSSQERYRPLHDLLRQVVYESMSHAERLRLHGRLVESLTDADAAAIEIAEHVKYLEDPALAKKVVPAGRRFSSGHLEPR